MFRFRLQTILDVRKIIEDKILIDFSEHQKVVRQEQENLQTIHQQKSGIMDEMRGLQGKKVSVTEIADNALRMKACRKSEEIQTERLREATEKAEKKREELLEASKKRKAMEILKAKKLDQYQFDQNMKEQSDIDEMAIVRHKRGEEE
jgi:flagellar FliJ protein